MLEQDERNIMLLVLIALNAYEEENGEAFSVNSEVVNQIIRDNIAEETSVPAIAIFSRNGRTYFEITMREPTESEVIKYDIGKEQDED